MINLNQDILQNKKKSLLKTRWLQSCIFLSALFIFGLIALPYGLKLYLEKWLVENGADKAVIEKLYLNPLVGTIALHGVDLQKDGNSLFSNSLVELNVNVFSILQRDILIERARYENLSIDLEQYPDGRWRLATYTTGVNVAEESIIEPKNTHPWDVFISKLSFSNCRVNLKIPGQELLLNVEYAELDNYSTKPDDKAGSLVLKGNINGAPVEFNLDTLRVVPFLDVRGIVKLSRLELDSISVFMGNKFEQLAGLVGVNGKVLYSQSKEKSITFEYDGFIGLLQTDISSSVLQAKGQSLTWDGEFNYADSLNNGVDFRLNGSIDGRNIFFDLPVARLHVEQPALTISGVTNVNIHENITVQSNASLSLGKTKVALPPYNVSDSSLSWQGSVDFVSGNHLKTDGNLLLENFLYDNDQEKGFASAEAESFNWQGKADLIPTSMQNLEKSIALHGILKGHGLSLFTADSTQNFILDNATLSGQVKAGLEGKMPVNGTGTFEADGLGVSLQSGNVGRFSIGKVSLPFFTALESRKFNVQNIELSDIAGVSNGELPVAYTVPYLNLSEISFLDYSSILVEDFLVRSPRFTSLINGEELLRLTSLELQNILIENFASFSADKFELTDLSFLKSLENSDRGGICSLGKGDLSSVKWNFTEGLVVDTLSLDGLLCKFIRDGNGRINMAKHLQSMMAVSEIQPQQHKETSQADSSAAKNSVKIEHILVQGVNSISGIEFEDYTLAVPFTGNMDIDLLKLDYIDTNAPEKEIQVLLKGVLSKRAPLVVKGVLFPFKDKPEVGLTVDLKNYPVERLSSYTVQTVGRSLAEGQLKVHSAISLLDDQVDIKNRVIISKLKTNTISRKLAGKLDHRLPLPLDTALMMLRDNKDTISLDIPVNGSISDFDVGITDIMVTALGNAIVPAASSYLMFTLGPYGALAYVGLKVGEMILEVKLPPVDFTPLKHELTFAHHQYLERIARILQERPDTDLHLCPTVAARELKNPEKKILMLKQKNISMSEQERTYLEQLGQRRAGEIKKFLYSSHGIAKNRLLLCETLVETGAKDDSSVNLRF